MMARLPFAALSLVLLSLLPQTTLGQGQPRTLSSVQTPPLCRPRPGASRRYISDVPDAHGSPPRRAGPPRYGCGRATRPLPDRDVGRRGRGARRSRARLPGESGRGVWPGPRPHGPTDGAGATRAAQRARPLPTDFCRAAGARPSGDGQPGPNRTSEHGAERLRAPPARARRLRPAPCPLGRRGAIPRGSAARRAGVDERARTRRLPLGKSSSRLAAPGLARGCPCRMGDPPRCPYRRAHPASRPGDAPRWVGERGKGERGREGEREKGRKEEWRKACRRAYCKTKNDLFTLHPSLLTPSHASMAPALFSIRTR